MNHAVILWNGQTARGRNSWRLRLFCLAFFIAFRSAAQITSPGLGDNTNTDTWMAIGFREQLDSSNSNHLLAYAGYGRESTRSDYNPLHLKGILVLNGELYHRFSPEWQGSLALSYRRQHEYEREEPYIPANPFLKQEFRAYGRCSHSTSFLNLKFTQTFRQELRRFCTPDFHDWKVPVQLRTRFKLQAVYALGKTRNHRLTAGAETLFTTDRKAGSWTTFSYSETRLSCFYSYKWTAVNATFSIGYMNDLLGAGTDVKDNHYFSVDVVFDNLFSRLRQLIV